MDASVASFVFSLNADDGRETSLGNFADLDGFFVGSSTALSEFDDEAASESHGDGAWLHPRLVGLTPSDALKEFWAAGSFGEKQLGNVWINIHDAHGEIIGSYFAGSVTLEDWTEGPDLTVTAVLSCWLSVLPERSAGTLWKTWSRRAPASMNDWVNLPLGQREGWIEVARKCRKTSSPAKKDGCYVLDGANIDDLASFYCGIGEAMNGPGGYYGSNLASLDDCLFGGHGPAAPFRLVWQNSVVAMNSLGALPTHIKNKTVMDSIIECFDRRGVTVELA
ncbi:barstar family protein [Streptomyces sp. ME18-1-4]|uniref:barstar family protein n=1 Tax=Streptomyces sp. ME18-1-4 TaxID=3028685 RepID=UPI0029B8B6F0|nr:barstar family protein [Streptomyces sp. ME18-1-4]MDX3243098.1 barstar family protein [Streptomyces sp. ME18-1-4]